MAFEDFVLLRVLQRTVFHVERITRLGVGRDGGQKQSFLFVIERMKKETIVEVQVSAFRRLATSTSDECLHIVGIGNVADLKVSRILVFLAAFLFAIVLDRLLGEVTRRNAKAASTHVDGIATVSASKFHKGAGAIGFGRHQHAKLRRHANVPRGVEGVPVILFPDHDLGLFVFGSSSISSSVRSRRHSHDVREDDGVVLVPAMTCGRRER
mmetsp:Transcript_29509/g.43592  ORF Transcript_29509/g.43592 Transcript_29509/m.43592 type:complete len:211 (+) Transcript_29509:439-1071(+)